MKKKLKIQELNVQSFVTSSIENIETIKGGSIITDGVSSCTQGCDTGILPPPISGGTFCTVCPATFLCGTGGGEPGTYNTCSLRPGGCFNTVIC